MGLQIAKYYQNIAFDYHNGIDDEAIPVNVVEAPTHGSY
jgi:hypothetical protein